MYIHIYLACICKHLLTDNLIVFMDNCVKFCIYTAFSYFHVVRSNDLKLFGFPFMFFSNFEQLEKEITKAL